MNFIDRIRENITNNHLPIEFSINNLKKCNDITENDMKNISNYDIKNTGSSNKNTKVLTSKNIHDETYYAFEKELRK